MGIHLRDDLEQELVIHWWKVRDRFKPDGEANERTYMVRVLENRARDLRNEQQALRRRAALQAHSLDRAPAGERSIAEVLEDPGEDTERQVEQADLKAAVRDWVGRLPSQDRDTAEAVRDERTATAAAKRLGITRPSLYDRLAHLRRAAKDEGLDWFL